MSQEISEDLKKAAWISARNLDLRAQVISGFIAWLVCSPAIAWMPAGKSGTVFSEFGFLGVLVIFALGLATIFGASLILAAQTASKLVK